MSQYADGTTVSVERSEAEIKALLRRHGIEKMGVENDDAAGKAVVWFVWGKTPGSIRVARISLGLPRRASFVGIRKAPRRSQAESEQRAYEQACREKWRLLVLLVKAKLEAVAAGVSTLDREFLADTVLPDGTPLEVALRPVLERVYLTGETPSILMLGPAHPNVME